MTVIIMGNYKMEKIKIYRINTNQIDMQFG